jgi:hypothetical protein
MLLEQPSTVIIDKARIQKFTIDPQYKRVTIQYSKRHEDSEVKYFPKENCKVDLVEIRDAQSFLQIAQLNFKNSQLELDNKILRVYLKHSMNEKDTMDIEIRVASRLVGNS